MESDADASVAVSPEEKRLPKVLIPPLKQDELPQMSDTGQVLIDDICGEISFTRPTFLNVKPRFHSSSAFRWRCDIYVKGFIDPQRREGLIDDTDVLTVLGYNALKLKLIYGVLQAVYLAGNWTDDSDETLEIEGQIPPDTKFEDLREVLTYKQIITSPMAERRNFRTAKQVNKSDTDHYLQILLQKDKVRRGRRPIYLMPRKPALIIVKTMGPMALISGCLLRAYDRRIKSYTEALTYSREEVEEMERINRCKICLDNDACVVFLPCCHMVACEMCASVLKRCAVCRSLISDTLKVNLQ